MLCGRAMSSPKKQLMTSGNQTFDAVDPLRK